MNLKLLTAFACVAVVACGISDGAPSSTPNGMGSTKDDPKPKDYFEDQISRILRMSVRELLDTTFTTFNNLNTLTSQGIQELGNILNQATPAVKAELVTIKANMESQISADVLNVIKDLATVLPSLSSVGSGNKTIHGDDGTNGIAAIGGEPLYSAADIILAILQRSLQVFIEQIARTLRVSNDVLTQLVDYDFKSLEAKASLEVRAALENIAENYLQPARPAVSLLSHNLEKLLSSTIRKDKMKRGAEMGAKQ